MKILVKNIATIKANLGTWKPASATDFPSWESVAKCKLFTDPAWAQFASDLGKPLLNPELKPPLTARWYAPVNAMIAMHDLFFLNACLPIQSRKCFLHYP